MAGEFSNARDGNEMRLASSPTGGLGVLGVGKGVGRNEELERFVRGFTRTVLERRETLGEEESRRSGAGGGTWVVIVGVSIPCI